MDAPRIYLRTRIDAVLSHITNNYIRYTIYKLYGGSAYLRTNTDRAIGHSDRSRLDRRRRRRQPPAKYDKAHHQTGQQVGANDRWGDDDDYTAHTSRRWRR